MWLTDRLRRFVDRTPRLTPEEVQALGTLEPVLGRPGFLADFRQGLLEMGCDPDMFADGKPHGQTAPSPFVRRDKRGRPILPPEPPRQQEPPKQVPQPVTSPANTPLARRGATMRSPFAKPKDD
jgi:hypothetical protein